MDNLDRILKAKGLTKTALADRLGIRKQNLNGLLKIQRSPPSGG